MNISLIAMKLLNVSNSPKKKKKNRSEDKITQHKIKGVHLLLSLYHKHGSDLTIIDRMNKITTITITITISPPPSTKDFIEIAPHKLHFLVAPIPKRRNQRRTDLTGSRRKSKPVVATSTPQIC